MFPKSTYLAALLATCAALHASPITDLYNTGVDAAGTPLADGTLGDPHYALINVPDGTDTIMVRRDVGGYPLPPYIGDDALSAWIGPANSAQLDGEPGIYIYRTTFTLGAGVDAATASIIGQLATDDPLRNMMLNGESLAFDFYGQTNFIEWTPFTIGPGAAFVEGLNTLDFVVLNIGGPTALRVEMTGTVESIPDVTLSGPLLAAAVASLLLVSRRIARPALVRIR